MTAEKDPKEPRFKPGQSGNPNGRPEGSRSKVNVALDALAEGGAREIVQAMINKAKGGDGQAGRTLLDRIPSLQDFAGDTAANILRDAANPKQGDESFEKISHMMVNASMAHSASLTMLFEHTATAHGLHQAAEAMQQAGQSDRARALRDLGQLFIQYAITDIGLLMSDTAWREGAVN